jgi:hypothetical protein
MGQLQFVIAGLLVQVTADDCVVLQPQIVILLVGAGADIGALTVDRPRSPNWPPA